MWELIVEAGRDPLTGKRRQVSRVFSGTLRDAKKARAELLAEVGQGRGDVASVVPRMMMRLPAAEATRTPMLA